MTIRGAAASPAFAGFTAPGGEPDEEQEDDDLMDFVDAHATGALSATDDEDELDDEEDEDEEDDEDEAEDADEEAAGQADPNPVSTLDTGSLTAQWVEQSPGVYLMRLHGDLYAQVNEVQRGDDKPVYTSIHFNGDQATLRRALDSIARNAAGRAVRVAWDASHPKEAKAKTTRASSSTKAEIDAIRQEMAEDRALLRQLVQAVTTGGLPSAAGNDDEPAGTPKQRLRIARG